MNRDDILAVVVSYNGGAGILQTVAALRDQVGHVYVVDNGSRSETLAVLDQLELQPGTSVTRVGENRGVGHALNLGVKRARERGYSWLLTMDQDSLADPSMVASYQAALAGDRSLVCLTPIIAGKDGRTGHTEGGFASYAISSGNLVAMRVFDRTGLYDADMFIDGIDFDFCLRLRRAGYSIRRVGDARMQHQLGIASPIPRMLRWGYAVHPPVRRYYMTRNFLYLAERYLLRFPVFIAKLGLAHMALAVLVAFLDPRPIQSYRAMARGVWDYLMRRVGPITESRTS